MRDLELRKNGVVLPSGRVLRKRTSMLAPAIRQGVVTRSRASAPRPPPTRAEVFVGGPRYDLSQNSFLNPIVIDDDDDDAAPTAAAVGRDRGHGRGNGDGDVEMRDASPGASTELETLRSSIFTSRYTPAVEHDRPGENNSEEADDNNSESNDEDTVGESDGGGGGGGDSNSNRPRRRVPGSPGANENHSGESDDNGSESSDNDNGEESDGGGDDRSSIRVADSPAVGRRRQVDEDDSDNDDVADEEDEPRVDDVDDGSIDNDHAGQEDHDESDDDDNHSSCSTVDYRNAYHFGEGEYRYRRGKPRDAAAGLQERPFPEPYMICPPWVSLAPALLPFPPRLEANTSPAPGSRVERQPL